MPTQETKLEPKTQKVHDSEGSEPSIAPVESEALGDYARDLAFMEEEVEITIAPAMTPNDTTRLVGPICVNGVGQYFVRGQPTKTKRKFLEVLLTAKTESWSFAYKFANDGQTKDVQYAVQSGRFHFASIRDNNPKGIAWMQQLQERNI